MPKKQIPASYKAGRPVRIGATLYATGAAIPNATVKTVKKLSALLSKRTIVPNVDPYSRQTDVASPTPTDVSPVLRKSL